MKVGLYLPQVGHGATPARVREVAVAAERSGYDSLWAYDHVVLRDDYGTPYPYSADGTLGMAATTPFLEAVTLLTWVAAVTERVQLGTGVLILPMRAPVLHAKMLATLDHLAGGRLLLGAGVGWWKEEFEALSMPFEQRGKRMDEYLQVLRELWTQDYGSFEGKFYNVNGWASSPKPPRHIPLLLGGDSAAQLARVGKFGDGWLPNPSMLENMESNFERAKAAAVAAGRDAEALTLTVNRVAVLSEQGLAGVADTLHALKRRGVDEAILNLHPAASDPAALLEAFAGKWLADIQG